jgi:hypothetical protein
MSSGAENSVHHPNECTLRLLYMLSSKTFDMYKGTKSHYFISYEEAIRHLLQTVRINNYVFYNMLVQILFFALHHY